MTTKIATATPRIYVACLAAYNNGFLHGAWIDATLAPDEIQGAISEMLKASPIPGAEEYAIHDHDGFGGVRISEWESIETVRRAAKAIEDLGDVFLAAYGIFCDVDEAARIARDCFLGEYDSLEDWAWEQVDQMELPEIARRYFDVAAYARDCALNGDIYSSEVDGRVFVFAS